MENKKLSKIQQRIKRDQEKVLEFLSESGNISFSCKRAGITRETFYRWRKTDEEFNEQVEIEITLGKSFVNDLAHTHLVRNIQDGDTQSIKFHLVNCHPDYNKNSTPLEDDWRPITQINLIPMKIEKKYGPDRSLYESDVPKEGPDVISNTEEID